VSACMHTRHHSVGSVLVTVVLVVDGVDGLLPSTFLYIVPSNGQGN
jgi:hypothetical protein